MRVMNSKKATMTGGAAVALPLLIMVLSYVCDAVLGLDADTTEAIVKTFTWAFGVIVAGYNVGQGVADMGKEGAPEVIEVHPTLYQYEGSRPVDDDEVDEGELPY